MGACLYILNIFMFLLSLVVFVFPIDILNRFDELGEIVDLGAFVATLVFALFSFVIWGIGFAGITRKSKTLLHIYFIGGAVIVVTLLAAGGVIFAEAQEADELRGLIGRPNGGDELNDSQFEFIDKSMALYQACCVNSGISNEPPVPCVDEEDDFCIRDLTTFNDVLQNDDIDDICFSLTNFKDGSLLDPTSGCNSPDFFGDGFAVLIDTEFKRFGITNFGIASLMTIDLILTGLLLKLRKTKGKDSGKAKEVKDAKPIAAEEIIEGEVVMAEKADVV